MAAKKGLKIPKSVEKAIARNVKPSLKEVKANRRELMEKANENIGKKAAAKSSSHIGAASFTEPPDRVPRGEGDEPLQTDTDPSAETAMAEQDTRLEKMSPVIDDGLATDKDAMVAMTTPEPQQLTLPLLTDSGTLFVQGVQQLTAQLLGQPESAVMLVKVNGWLDDLGKVKKLIVGDDDKVEGLKAKVISDGEPWGEKGSKQLTLAGAVVKVKAVNWRDASAPLTINDLDPAKVEAYLRSNAVDPEKTLAGYMKMTPTWGLKDLSPLQQKNLSAMLADPGEWGQGLRQCLKETKWQMMAPEMAVES